MKKFNSATSIMHKLISYYVAVWCKNRAPNVILSNFNMIALIIKFTLFVYQGYTIEDSKSK